MGWDSARLELISAIGTQWNIEMLHEVTRNDNEKWRFFVSVRVLAFGYSRAYS